MIEVAVRCFLHGTMASLGMLRAFFEKLRVKEFFHELICLRQSITKIYTKSSSLTDCNKGIKRKKTPCQVSLVGRKLSLALCYLRLEEAKLSLTPCFVNLEGVKLTYTPCFVTLEGVKLRKTPCYVSLQ